MDLSSYFPQKRCDRIRISFPTEPTHTLTHGIGLNWHHRWQPPGAPRDCAPPLDDAEAWDLLFRELSVVRPHAIRFGYAADRFVDEAGSIDFSADGFVVLDRLNTWAAEHDASIVFDPWIIPKAFSIGTVDGSYYDAPRDPDAFVADFVRPLLFHIRIERRWDRVTGFNLLNEPFYVPGRSYDTPDETDRFVHYADLHERIRSLIDAEALDFELYGPGTNNTFYWACEDLELRGRDIRPTFDVLDHHHYTGRFDYLPPNPTTIPSVPLSDLMYGLVRKYIRYAAEAGRPYVVSEFGTGYYGWSNGDPWGAATQEAFVTDAEFVIRGCIEGIGGFFRWAFLAPGEYQDGCWQFINTVDRSFTRMEHTFYGFAALMRTTSRGARVHPPRSDERLSPYRHVHSVLLENPDGTQTILVVNDHSAEERIVGIELPTGSADDRWQRFVNDRVRKMRRNEPTIVDGTIVDVLPPMSLTVYTTRHLADDDAFPSGNNVFPPL